MAVPVVPRNTGHTVETAAEQAMFDAMLLTMQSTVMRRWDGTRIWYPNVKLGAMPLLNMSRSDAKVELFKVCNVKVGIYAVSK